MSKKEEYETIAAQYFIEMQMTAGQIAKRLNLSEKTVHNWKKAGEWETKRKRYLKSQYSTNQTLYELLHMVAKKALEDFKNEEIMPDQKTCYFIMSLTDKLAKLKQFETQTSEEKIAELSENAESSKDKESLKKDVLENIFKSIIGG